MTSIPLKTNVEPLNPEDQYWNGRQCITKQEFDKLAEERGALRFDVGDVVRMTDIAGPSMKVMKIDAIHWFGSKPNTITAASVVFDGEFVKNGWHIRREPVAELFWFDTAGTPHRETLPVSVLEHSHALAGIVR